MTRRLAWSVLGLGLALGACGRATRNPEPAPTSSEGGCTSDCPSDESGGGGGPGGAPTESLGGSFTQPSAGSFNGGGTFSTGAESGGSVALPPCPNGYRGCADNQIYRCRGLNEPPTIDQNCGVGAHCMLMEYQDAICLPDTCQPGQVACIGNTLKTCAADGNYPNAGTDCGDQACWDGACRPKICEPGSLFCLNGDVHLCMAQGAQGQIEKGCAAGSSCASRPSCRSGPHSDSRNLITPALSALESAT